MTATLSGDDRVPSRTVPAWGTEDPGGEVSVWLRAPNSKGNDFVNLIGW